jgi:ribonuclease H / adenosylcobalamin/alpha-ribazole phosphatase
VTRARHVVVNTDGGARGNPGPAAIGAVIATPAGEVIAEIAEALGVATNNVAEYTAVVRALEHAASLGATSVELRSDSLLLVEQLNGRFKVKNPTLQVLHQKVRDLAKSFETVRFSHVRRERNTAADALVNEALDAWMASHDTPEPPARPEQGSLLDD